LELAYITEYLSELRGGPFLMLNFAKAVVHHAKEDLLHNIKLYSIEDYEATDQSLNIIYDSIKHYKDYITIIPVKVKHYSSGGGKIDVIFKSLKGIHDVQTSIVTLNFLTSHSKIVNLISLQELLKHLLSKYDILHMGYWNAPYAYAAYEIIKTSKDRVKAKVVCHAILHPPTDIRGKSFLRRNIITKIERIAIKEVLSTFDAVTVSTPYELQVLRLLGIKRAYYVGETIDLNFIKQNEKIIEELSAEILTQMNENHIIAYIGARCEKKGYIHFLKAFNNLISYFPNVISIVIGRYPLSKVSPLIVRLEKELMKKGKLIIFQNVSELFKYAVIKAGDFVVLPSFEETIPLVFLEAWSLQKPVIGSNIPTIASIMRYNGDGGILIEPGNISDIERAMYKLLLDAGIRSRYGSTGYNKLIENFSLDTIGKKLLSIYKEIKEI